MLNKARFVEMFGDPVTNSLNWEEHYLNEYIEFLTSGSRGWAQYFVDEEDELFITIKNVKNNHISLNNIQYINAPNSKEAERTKVKTGDLLISITAELGRTGVVDEVIASRGAYINQHLSLVRLDQKKVNPLYVSHFLETNGGKIQFESKNQNGVKAGLNFDAINSLKILVPPLEKQNEYLDFVHQVDKSKFVDYFLFVLIKYVFLNFITLIISINNPINMKSIPKSMFSFNDKIPAKITRPIIATKNNDIITINGYLIYLGILLLLLASILSSRTNSNINSNINSIFTTPNFLQITIQHSLITRFYIFYLFEFISFCMNPCSSCFNALFDNFPKSPQN